MEEADDGAIAIASSIKNIDHQDVGRGVMDHHLFKIVCALIFKQGFNQMRERIAVTN